MSGISRGPKPDQPPSKYSGSDSQISESGDYVPFPTNWEGGQEKDQDNSERMEELDIQQHQMYQYLSHH